MKRRQVGGITIAAVLVAGIWTGLNSSKPMHIDDPLFIYWARTIAPLPGEKPVEFVNWEYFHEPLMNQVHPWAPGWSLLLAGVRNLMGRDSVPVYHLLQWPFAAMFLAGTAMLAPVFSVSPWLVLALCATSPIFLVSSSGVMADMAGAGPVMLGFAIWLGCRSLGWRIMAGLLIVLGGQMKQTMLPLLPMLFLVPGGGFLRGWRNMAVAIAACLLAGAYPPLPPAGSTEGSLWNQVALILNWSFERGGLYAPKAAFGFSVLSALVVFPSAFLFIFFAGRERRPSFAAAKVLIATIILVLALGNTAIWKGYHFGRGFVAPVPFGLTAVWFVAAFAVFMLWLIGRIWWGGLAGKPWRWLLAWLALVWVASVVGTPFPAVRFLVFAVPAIAILVADSFQRFLSPGTARLAVIMTLIGNIWLGVGLAKSDYAFASFNCESAFIGAKEAERLRLPLWTTGQWGLRWYVEQAGGSVLGEESEKLPRGAVMMAPRITDHRMLPPALGKRVIRRTVRESPPPTGAWLLFAPARTLGPAGSSAGYHGGHVWIPYVFSMDPVEINETLVISPLK